MIDSGDTMAQQVQKTADAYGMGQAKRSAMISIGENFGNSLIGAKATTEPKSAPEHSPK